MILLKIYNLQVNYMIELLIEGMTENKGGKETYIINIFNFLDKTKYHVTFVSYNKEIAYEIYLKNNGATIVKIPPRHDGLYQHRKALDNLFSKQYFDIVWAHKTTLSACEILSISKKNGVPVRIIHSHSSANMGGKFTYVMHNINRKCIFRIANNYFACSVTAARWFYGKHPSQIMINGIDLDKFKYNPSLRDKIRKEMNLDNSFLIGHVGRFGIEKNHKKLINIFNILKQKKENSKLILCGDGEERNSIEQQIEELDLKTDVLLLGNVDNVNEILQAIDIMVMPSLFEGFPFALLEAQTAGLRCVVSDTVSKEIDVLGWNQFLPLSLDDNLWADNILKNNSILDRYEGYRIIKEKGYDLNDCLSALEKKLNEFFQ